MVWEGFFTEFVIPRFQQRHSCHWGRDKTIQHVALVDTSLQCVCVCVCVCSTCVKGRRESACGVSEEGNREIASGCVWKNGGGPEIAGDHVCKRETVNGGCIVFHLVAAPSGTCPCNHGIYDGGGDKLPNVESEICSCDVED